MVLLSDSDLVIKLSEFDLLDEALEILGVTSSNTYVLNELSHVLKSSRIASKYSREGIQRALDFASKAQLVLKIDQAEQIVLHKASAVHRNIPQTINGGEAILYSATKHFKDFVIATGDKRSLRALAMDSSCSAIYDRLKGHVYCLEQLVLKIIDSHGYKHVQQCIGPRCECDECLTHAFAGGKLSQSEQVCRTWLDGYVKDLRVDTKDLLSC
jgi:hypothetical protein